MDKTLKILLACLGVSAIAILAIPPGDPLANSDQAPIAAANPAGGQAVNNAAPVSEINQANVARKTEAPAYVPPHSDQSSTNSVDSATLQQQTFGQPMFDPRPASERQGPSAGGDRSVQEGPVVSGPQFSGGQGYNQGDTTNEDD
jgi:hypothetical protein